MLSIRKTVALLSLATLCLGATSLNAALITNITQDTATNLTVDWVWTPEVGEDITSEPTTSNWRVTFNITPEDQGWDLAYFASNMADNHPTLRFTQFLAMDDSDAQASYRRRVRTPTGVTVYQYSLTREPNIVTLQEGAGDLGAVYITLTATRNGGSVPPQEVPEPASMALLGVGALLMLRRRTA